MPLRCRISIIPAGVHGTPATSPADLLVLSKGLANGHLLSAVLGRRDLADHFDRARLAGTYNRELPPMAAALETLRILAEEPVHDREPAYAHVSASPQE